MPQTFTINNAPIELLDVNEMVLVHEQHQPLDTFLLDRFFPNSRGFARDEVPVGELSAEIDIAPLVAPTEAGVPFDPKTLAKVDFVKPAYLKPKNQVTTSNSFDLALVRKLRDAGILSTGSQALSDQDKLILAQIETIQRNRNSIDNRKVLMAAEYLTTGQMVLESDKYKKNVVSFGRDSSLSYNPTIAWDQANATPYRDIKAMAQLLVDNGAGTAKVLLTSSKNWGYLQADAEFKEVFIKPNEGINIPFVQTMGIGESAVFRGTFDNIEVWTYDATYVQGGQRKRYIPSGYVGLISDVSGFIAQCQIKHLEAAGQPLDYFDVQWQEKDPSGILVLTESAPLPVPSNKNGVCGGTAFSS
ncbi:major capsid protein [Acinetobacter thermotolerans]|uniref:major capsid protein n=1 Tax=Acinetobacter thermotolerans TaxID=3151487 RepID=UPI00325AB228